MQSVGRITVGLESWDRQIKKDSESGKLDRLLGEAREAHDQGKGTRF
jgi:hypothetical protein